MKKISLYFFLISIILFNNNTSDAQNWQEWTWVKVPFTKALHGVYFQDSDSGWVVGGKLKEAGTSHWYSPNTGATNSSGFSALPGGYRDFRGTFIPISYRGIWWSSTEYDAYDAWLRHLDFDRAKIYRYYYYKDSGFSVRCLRD